MIEKLKVAREDTNFRREIRYELHDVSEKQIILNDKINFSYNPAQDNRDDFNDIDFPDTLKFNPRPPLF